MPNEGRQRSPEDEAVKRVQLRLHPEMIEEIDAARQQRKRGKRLPRHAWIMAAIEGKLEQG